MACGICEHCHSPVSHGEEALYEGFSYHKDCYKCYVCSETDLESAEVFKGVIFCSACARRIFQGCASVRRTKQQVSSRLKRSRSKSRRRRGCSKLPEKGLDENMNGVIELAHLAGSSSSSCHTVVKKKKSRHNNKICTEIALQVGNGPYEASENMKRGSVDIGTTTFVTQELLTLMAKVISSMQINEMKEVPSRHFAEVIPRDISNIKRRKRKKDILLPQHNKEICSDLRIAELGASTEIANMALRKKSEVPIIIKSENKRPLDTTDSGSTVNEETGTSRDEKICMESSDSMINESDKELLDMRLGSILKIPYRFFKRNILARSSLISVLISTNAVEKISLLKRFKMLFYEEITEHQGRGIRRLYSTINRRKTDYQMGWLHLVAKMSKAVMQECGHNQNGKPKKICKHYNQSHSYRCMRAQAMRLAGPTRSQLACIRRKFTPKVMSHVTEGCF